MGTDASQSRHTQAASTYRTRREQGDQFITTNYILTETVALLTRPLNVARPAVIAFVETLRTATHVEVVHIDEALDEKAWRLLKERPDKAWSLVDCSSFILMRERGLREALTSDHHFEQAGFVRLLN